ncbi:hypothetical protein U9M48_019835 [Paspalum notatum var. saurae]|uniref:Uncharacterized protein n=1 Tax=Paspalum notatum var. saurae TaxID=547442 RepID=A0AAQ3TGG9_PASNO
MADPDRIFGEELTPAEIRLYVIAITEGTSTANLLGGPLALNHSIKEDLGIGSMRPSPAPLPEDAAVKADRKRKREAEAHLADERKKCHQLARDRKKREHDQRAREEGRSPTPSTASSDEEWSSDDTLEAVPLAGEIGESSGSDVLPEAMLIMTPPAAGAVPPLRGSQESAGESQRVPVLATVVQARVELVVEVPSSPEPKGSGVPVAVLTSTSVATQGTEPVEASRGSGTPVLPSGASAELAAGSSSGALVAATVQGSPPGSESSLLVGTSVAPVASHAPRPHLRVDAPSVSLPASANVPPVMASRVALGGRTGYVPGGVICGVVVCGGAFLAGGIDPPTPCSIAGGPEGRRGGSGGGGGTGAVGACSRGCRGLGCHPSVYPSPIASSCPGRVSAALCGAGGYGLEIVQEVSTSAAVDVEMVLESLRMALAAASRAEEAISQRVLRHGAALLARATERISSLGAAQAEAAQARTNASRSQEARPLPSGRRAC